MKERKIVHSKNSYRHSEAAQKNVETSFQDANENYNAEKPSENTCAQSLQV